jgi:hypothetical protein
MTAWWHYTCEHKVSDIEATGVVLPQTQQMLGGLQVAWFTNMPSASRQALGLTSHMLNCDRMSHLFHVLPVDEHKIVEWGRLRSQLSRSMVIALESAPGTRPMFWGVAADAVQIERIQ